MKERDWLYYIFVTFDILIRPRTFYKYRHTEVQTFETVWHLKVFKTDKSPRRNKDFTEDKYNIWCLVSNYLFIFYSKLLFYDCIVKMDDIFLQRHRSVVNLCPLDDNSTYGNRACALRSSPFYRGLRSISSLSDLPFAISSAKTSGTSRPCRNSDSLPWCRPKMLLWIPFFTCHSGARQRDQAAGNETVPRPSAKKTPDPSWTEGWGGGGTWRAYSARLNVVGMGFFSGEAGRF